MEENRLRETWNGCTRGMGGYDSREIETLLRGRHRTALVRLMDRYRRFVAIASAMTATSVLMCFAKPLYGDRSVTLAVVFTSYFLLCAAIDWNMYRRVAAIDVLHMPTSEVIDRAMRCRRAHLTAVCVLLPLAVGICCVMAWAAGGNTAIICGMLTGGVVGAVIGGCQLAAFMRDYRAFTSD